MGPTWPFVLMYGSHGMRHTGFPQVDDGQRDPWDRGVTRQQGRAGLRGRYTYPHNMHMHTL